MTNERVRLVLDVDLDEVPGGPPRGRLAVEGAPPGAFAGWMQLAQAIETALDTARHPHPSTRGDRSLQHRPSGGAGPATTTSTGKA